MYEAMYLFSRLNLQRPKVSLFANAPLPLSAAFASKSFYKTEASTRLGFLQECGFY